MSSPWLSVIIPTYNGERYLAAALGSIVEASDVDIECIIVDDDSTDSTIRIINTYADKIPITVHSVSRSGNWAANSNVALALAVGEYVCFLHQDDFWLAHRIRILRGLTQQYPEAELFFSPALFVDRQGRSVGQWRCPLPGQPGPVDSGLLLSRLLIQNFMAIPGPLFKRKTALGMGGLDESLWYTADWDFWLKLAKYKTVYYPHPLVAFRIHAHSQTIQRSFDSAGFRQQMETVLYRHIGLLHLEDGIRERIKRKALFSIQLNTALAARIHGEKFDVGNVVSSFIKLGPVNCWQYLRDSRIIERVSARLRACILSK